jgi:hypothetical protein
MLHTPKDVFAYPQSSLWSRGPRPSQQSRRLCTEIPIQWGSKVSWDNCEGVWKDLGRSAGRRHPTRALPSQYQGWEMETTPSWGVDNLIAEYIAEGSTPYVESELLTKNRPQCDGEQLRFAGTARFPFPARKVSEERWMCSLWLWSSLLCISSWADVDRIVN